MPNVVRKDLFAEKVLKSAAFQKKAESLMDKNFTRAKKELLNDFDSSKVTQEINGEAGSSNLSGTLKGTGGNLWGFIGFLSNPIPKLRSELEDISYHKSEVTKNRITFRVLLPSLKELYSKNPYPDGWSPGSWLKGIEHGISGLRFFIAGARLGRSRAGIQVEHNEVPVREGSFKTVEYIGAFLRKFKERIRESKDTVK